MRCVLCKNAETRSKYINGKSCTVCPICGAIFEDPNDAYLCYGDKKSRGMDVLFTVSDRYIFFHRLKGFERIIYGLGIIFGIIIAMMVRSAKKNRMPYSFVDINDVDHIIAPYKNRKFKKDDAMKFVMKDGSELFAYPDKAGQTAHINNGSLVPNSGCHYCTYVFLAPIKYEDVDTVYIGDTPIKIDHQQ